MFLHDIPVYRAEASAGLTESIQQQNSLAYISPVEVATTDIKEKIIKSVASLNSNNKITQAINSKASANDSDLYFTKSVLVTTSWNKNDDVFDPLETWTSRHTPSHKPTNLEHDEKQLVGHIIDVWPIDGDGNVIPDNCVIEDLPSKYHLVTGAVIYKNWEDKDLLERTEALIKAIESGKKFVSMEVLFTDFDYAVQSPDGKIYSKARNEDTSWMTKFLRAYGGRGEYDGFKIGRKLKNMTFSGKGYVDKPANPESVILSVANSGLTFSSATINVNSQDCGVSEDRDKTVSHNKNNGDLNMSETNAYKDRAEQLEKTVAELQSNLAEVNDKLAKADVEKYVSQVEELTNKVTAQDEEITTLKTQLDEAKSQVEEATKAVEDEKSAKAELQTKLDEMTEAELKSNRISTLVDGGIEKDVATEKVEKFANLNDEQFESIASELINAAKAQTTATAEDTSKDSESEEDEVADGEQDEADANAEDEVLETAEANEQEADLSVASEESDDDVADLRKELAQAIAARLGRNINHDGDQ